MVNIVSVIEESARRWPAAPAIIDESGTLTFRELAAEVERLRVVFQPLIPPGTGIGLRLPNGRNFLVTLMALAAAGATVMPLGAQAREAELTALLEGVPLAGIIGPGSTGTVLPLAGDPCALRWLRPDPVVIAPHVPDAVFIRPTSGTTGRSKGVVFSHATVLARLAAADEAFHLTPADRVAWVLPMAWHFIVSLLLYVRSGAAIVICRDPLAADIIAAIREHHCTLFYGSPTHIALLAADRSDVELPTLRFVISTSAGLAPQSAAAFQHRFGVPVTQIFGIIEVGLPLGNLTGAALNPGSVGRPLPRYEAVIRGDDGAPVPTGVPGHLGVRGPGMFDAYLLPPQLRAEVLEEGWFMTGDIATAGSDGSLTIVGRSKSVIGIAGHKVFPEEIEQVLCQHPGVACARVVGRKHPLYGEIVRAEVEPRPGVTLDPESIISFARKRLSPWKAPHEVIFVHQVALTPTGKPLRVTSPS